MRYLSYFGEKTEQEERAVADSFRVNQIRYAYFHVLDMTREGTLRNKKLPEVRRLVNTFHALVPNTKIIAWTNDRYVTFASDPSTEFPLARQS
jgi:hypothetical protein